MLFVSVQNLTQTGEQECPLSLQHQAKRQNDVMILSHRYEQLHQYVVIQEDM